MLGQGQIGDRLPATNGAGCSIGKQPDGAPEVHIDTCDPQGQLLNLSTTASYRRNSRTASRSRDETFLSLVDTLTSKRSRTSVPD
jgi:hypothetical protein